MTDYKKLYFALLNTVSTTIEHLKTVQCSVENAYIENADPSGVTDSYEDQTKAAD